MRYRSELLAEGKTPPSANALTDDFVTLTVWMTLFIGILFTVVGLRSGQRWLVFWGALTLVACVWYWLYFLLR
jgi:hypothetical protein